MIFSKRTRESFIKFKRPMTSRKNWFLWSILILLDRTHGRDNLMSGKENKMQGKCSKIQAKWSKIGGRYSSLDSTETWGIICLLVSTIWIKVINVATLLPKITAARRWCVHNRCNPCHVCNTHALHSISYPHNRLTPQNTSPFHQNISALSTIFETARKLSKPIPIIQSSNNAH